MEAQIEIWPSNSGTGQRAGAGDRLRNLHALQMQRGDAMLQSHADSSQKTRPSLRCTECGKPAKELFIVRPEGEICEDCLTPEDLTKYPEFARSLGLVKGKEAA